MKKLLPILLFICFYCTFNSSKAQNLVLFEHDSLDFRVNVENGPGRVHLYHNASKIVIDSNYYYILKPQTGSNYFLLPYYLYKYDRNGRLLKTLPLGSHWRFGDEREHVTTLRELPDNSLLAVTDKFLEYDRNMLYFFKIPKDLSHIAAIDSTVSDWRQTNICVDSNDIFVFWALTHVPDTPMVNIYKNTFIDYDLNLNRKTTSHPYLWRLETQFANHFPTQCLHKKGNEMIISFINSGFNQQTSNVENNEIINTYWNNQGLLRVDSIRSPLLNNGALNAMDSLYNLINVIHHEQYIFYHVLHPVNKIVHVYQWDTLSRILNEVNTYKINGLFSYQTSIYEPFILGQNLQNYNYSFPNGDFVTDLSNDRRAIDVNYNLQLYHNSGIIDALPEYSSTNAFQDSGFVLYNDRLMQVYNYYSRNIISYKDEYYLFGSLYGYSPGVTDPQLPMIKFGLDLLFLKKLSGSQGFVRGNIYKDINKNCLQESTDRPFENILIELFDLNSHEKYYAISADSGKYFAFIDTGIFRIKTIPPSEYWSSCTVPTIILNHDSSGVIQHLGLKKLIECHKLTVSISTDRLRACQNATYFVNYCNRGTADAVNPIVKVTMDSALSVTSASVPYTQSGDIYTFQLNNVKEDSCGQFIIHVLPACDLVPGSTHCVKAHIFPDSICVPADPRWDRSNVSVDGACLGDSVLFRIRNIGTGNMSSIKKYIVIEDNVLRVRPTDFQLDAGEELLIKREANGSTQRLIAEQTDYFPYPSNPTAVVEGCGGMSTGFVNAFANDDAADFVAISCMEAMNSFDPNDKLASPSGVNDEHYISLGTPLNYTIRFQNTGNDTAYDIVIYDTLSNQLDIASLQMDAASHAYSYEISGSGKAVLKVTFRNINLVDSFHNEPLSNGFFSYSIKQDTLNEEGDVIYNDAYIYFDANHPIKTNTTWHTIGDPYYHVISSVVNSNHPIQTLAYPNPFRDKCFIEIKSLNNNHLKYHFMLYDLSGRIIEEETVTNRIEIDASNLTSSIYLYRIELNGELVGAGKIVKE